MFTKLGRDEVLMAWHMHKDDLVISAKGADPGQGQIGYRGGGGGGVPLLQKSSSDRKATATNRIHSNNLEACVMKGCCYAPGSNDRGHIVFVLSVCLSVCLFVCLFVCCQL